MKAIVAHAAKDVRIEDVASEAAGAGEVRIATRDRRRLRQRSPLLQPRRVRSCAFERADDSRVTKFRLMSRRWAGASRAFRSANSSQFRRHVPAASAAIASWAFTISASTCGSMAAQCRFPTFKARSEKKLVADVIQCVPADGLTAGEAAMAEPLAVTLHATRRAGEMVGKRVLITGCGPIGLLSILCARRAGAQRSWRRTSPISLCRLRPKSAPTEPSIRPRSRKR